MAETIKDGAGSGFLARVDARNRLVGTTVTDSQFEDSNLFGNAYNVNSGLITLTTAGESGIIYLKNKEALDFHVTRVVAIFGPSSGGSTVDTVRVRVYRNPTTGTLITNTAGVAANSNRNFGSSNDFDSDAFAGAEGNTITDGSVHIDSLIDPGSRVSFGVDEILIKDNTIAVSFEPPDSNESMKTMCALVGYLREVL